MADKTEQPVVTEADAAATPAAEASKDAPAVEDLDALLAQYDESVKPADAAAQPAAANPASEQTQENDLTARIRSLVEHQERQRQLDEANEAKRQSEAIKQAVDDAAKVVRGDLPDDVASDRLARAWLKDAADNDPRIQAAFKDREKNPEGWNKILTSLSREFAKEMKRPDQAATEDREAVTAAVRGASSNAPAVKEPDVAHASDSDLRKQTQEKYGYTPHF